jgi:hypothetical protein
MNLGECAPCTLARSSACCLCWTARIMHALLSRY